MENFDTCIILCIFWVWNLIPDINGAAVDLRVFENCMDLWAEVSEYSRDLHNYSNHQYFLNDPIFDDEKGVEFSTLGKK
jgi:hypothetical protein